MSDTPSRRDTWIDPDGHEYQRVVGSPNICRRVGHRWVQVYPVNLMPEDLRTPLPANVATFPKRSA